MSRMNKDSEEALPKFVVYDSVVELYHCTICDKSFSKYGVKNHISIVHDGKSYGFGKGNIPWSKGKKVDNSSFKLHVWTEEERTALSIQKKLYAKENPFKHSEETKRQISEIMRLKGAGGYRKGSGRGKSGWYKGYYCDSSWELAVVIFCLENNIQIKRNTEKRHYEFDGKIRNYIPDFFINGILTEIKGYNSKQWEAKYAFNKDITIIDKEGIKPYISYVESIYGKDFIKLYENMEGTEQGSKSP